MKIEQYILRFLIWFGLAGGILTTSVEIYSYQTINATILFNFGTMGGVLLAFLLERRGRTTLAGLLLTAIVVSAMILELFFSKIPQQGTLAIFMAIAMSNSILFNGRIRIAAHTVTFLSLCSALFYIKNSGYELPNDSAYLSMSINILVIYNIIGFATYAVKRRYDQVISKLNGFNDELEAKVESRRKQLIDYSFKNSHEVRAPLTRILSLVELSKKDRKVLNEEQNIKILDKSATELDGIIKEVNLILNKEKEGE